MIIIIFFENNNIDLFNSVGPSITYSMPVHEHTIHVTDEGLFLSESFGIWALYRHLCVGPIYTAGGCADYNYNAVWTALLIIIVRVVIAVLSCVAFLQWRWDIKLSYI